MGSTGSEQVEEARKYFRWRRKYFHILVLLASIAITVAFIVFLGRLESLAEGYESYGYPGIFLMGLIGSSAPIWPMPGSMAAFIAGGIGWNPFLIALAAGVGEAIGESVGYMAGYGGQIAVEKIKFYPRIEEWMKRRGSLLVFLVSAVPNHFVKLVGAAAGALRFPVWKFYLVCCIGKIIKSLGFAYAGLGLFSLVSRYFEGQNILWIILVIGLAVAALVAGLVFWRQRKKGADQQDE